MQVREEKTGKTTVPFRPTERKNQIHCKGFIRSPHFKTHRKYSIVIQNMQVLTVVECFGGYEHQGSSKVNNVLF